MTDHYYSASMGRKKKYRVIQPVEKDKDGHIVLRLDASEASTDWLKYGRLKKLAEKGDKKAQKEIERMDNSEMIEEAED